VQGPTPGFPYNGQLAGSDEAEGKALRSTTPYCPMTSARPFDQQYHSSFSSCSL